MTVNTSRSMRRSDHDVTDRIQITDPESVGAEVVRLYTHLFPGAKSRAIERAFRDLAGMYRGESRHYHPCDTEYHDIQHILDVTLAMARLMDGYERKRDGHAPLSADHFAVGVVAALFHDFGYLRRKADHTHRYGAEYTLGHVTRSAEFLRGYLKRIGLGRYAAPGSAIVHFTGYERNTESIRLTDPLFRRLGEMLGTADIIAQMSDRCYLEKCRDRLYPEFVLGGLARRTLPGGRTQWIFRSGNDLVFKTPGFYENATRRLDHDLNRAYALAESHFGGQNLYLDEMLKNVTFARVVAERRSTGMLRRNPPYTLLPTVQPYPSELVIR